jgi:hypothetical protein
MSVVVLTVSTRFVWKCVCYGLAAALLFPASATLALGAWSVVPTPNPSGGGQNVLNAVAVVSPPDVWVVGQGKLLSIVPSPNVGTITNMNGVAAVATNDVWAVGDQWGGGLGMTMHWNGSTWSQTATPSPDGGENFLNGVLALAANNLWAVGQSGLQSFILHWNGSKWSRVKSPNRSAPAGYTEINTLRAIAGAAANDLWTVGNAGASTLALHWNGSSWSVVPTPNGPSPWNLLTGVAAVSSNDVWAVGYSYSEIDTCNEGCYEDIPSPLIEHWDGTSWTVVAAPSTGVSSLAAVAAATTGPAWAVGNASGQTLAEHNLAP